MGVMPYVGLNTLKGPMTDVRVRQAVNYGVDRALIKAALFNDRGILAAGPISPRTFGADLSLQPYPYDVEKAKALLAEAGYPDGFEIRMSYPTNMTQIQEQAQAIASDLEKIGLKVTLDPLDRAVMSERYKNRELEMYIYWWDDNPEPDRYMYSLFHSNSRDYYYKNASNDALLDKGRSTLDRDDRVKIYNEIDSNLYEEAPWLYLYIIPETYAVAPSVDYVGRRDGFLFMRFAEPAAN
jgi:peptide/nickel transport system substrate-binding protein